MNVLIVDGYNLYAANNATAGKLCRSDGYPTGALYGMIRSIEAQVRDRSIDRVWIALESGSPSVRRIETPEYKGNRDHDVDSVAVWKPGHLELMLEWASCRGVHVIWGDGLEADDAIAYVHARERGHDQFILSRDHDFKALLNDRTCMVWSKKTVTVDDFVSQFGFEPQLYPKYLALAGDPTDNVPRAVKPARAKKLVQEGADVEHVLEGEELATYFRNWTLVSFRLDRPFYVRVPVHDDDGLRELYDGLEFRSLSRVLSSNGVLK